MGTGADGRYSYTDRHAQFYGLLGIEDTTYQIGFDAVAKILGDIGGKTFRGVVRRVLVCAVGSDGSCRCGSLCAASPLCAVGWAKIATRSAVGASVTWCSWLGWCLTWGSPGDAAAATWSCSRYGASIGCLGRDLEEWADDGGADMLLRGGRRACRNGPGPAAGPLRCRGYRPGKARRLPARLPW
jgi:hypothetical protein